ncbi:raffinose/stachyose/melibiose transport system permease protein [Palleronia marisminoris]|uniref:L-arabinose transport system permease protein AraQ n=1 Tax=Palleronia marisminoris TaxID=315423 RepID=A0A1Y5TUX5_9RHOB|nr:carbohydrate ABC transporter permease [Palleronia marisminoris]SFH47280.1 raffinose/stachyose/melibiose transport system permease protein [Palleronia marisminoris]SLN68632.1 L-arabinose transport system permease protein AraQ [Palleronia marisminoris]
MIRPNVWRNVARLALLLVVASFVLAPLWATVMGGFKTNAEIRTSAFGMPDAWNFEFYGAIVTDPTFWRYLGNSMLISSAAVVLTLIVGSAAAYVFAQIRFFGSDFLFSYLLLGLMFPFATAILPLFIKIRDMGLLDTYWAVILPQTAFGLSLAILLFRTFFAQLPKELFEAAYIDGCGYVRFFIMFTLPLSTPILATVGVFVFVQSWNNFLLPLVVLNSREVFTWPLGMMQYRGEYVTQWNQTLAFVTLSLVPAVIFFLAAQKYIVAGLTGGAVKG